MTAGQEKVKEYIDRIKSGEPKEAVMQGLPPSFVQAIEIGLEKNENRYIPSEKLTEMPFQLSGDSQNYEQRKKDDEDKIKKLKLELGAIEKSRKEEEIYKMINGAQLVAPLDRSKAPFKGFSDNNKERWNYVPNDEIEQYLESKFFFNTHTIDPEDVKEIITLRKESDGTPIKIPLDLVVCATGFDDWRGRSKQFNKSYTSPYTKNMANNEMSSLNVIKHYANLPSNLPSVSVMRMFIQPNGTIFFDNSGGDSHRIAAALLRGENTIDAETVVVCQLDKDYL